MLADLVIHGATLVTDSTTFAASVAIKDGAILAIGAADAMPDAAEVLDATGKYLLPGAIDAHVHFRDPGYTHKETWETGTASAAMGGVTTVFEMPNTNPPTGTVEALNLKLKQAETAYVDFGIYGLLGESNIDELEALIEGGVAAFKCFMGNTFGNLPSPPSGAILEGFEIVAKHGYRVALHAENASIMARRQKKLMAAGRCDPLAHLDARPRSWRWKRWPAPRSWPNGPARASTSCMFPRATNCAPCAKPSCAGWISPPKPARITCCSTSTPIPTRSR
jgi:dihydroorotase